MFTLSAIERLLRIESAGEKKGEGGGKERERERDSESTPYRQATFSTAPMAGSTIVV